MSVSPIDIAILLAYFAATIFAGFWVSWASGTPLEDCQSGFRFYPRSVLESVDADHGLLDGFTYEAEFLINAARAGHGISFAPITVTYPANHMQQTHYRHVRDNARMIRMIAGKLLARCLDAWTPARFRRAGLRRS